MGAAQPQPRQTRASSAQGKARSITHCVRPGIEPVSPWILIGFVPNEPQREPVCVPWSSHASPCFVLSCRLPVTFLFQNGGSSLCAVDDSNDHVLSVWDWQKEERLADVKVSLHERHWVASSFPTGVLLLRAPGRLLTSRRAVGSCPRRPSGRTPSRRRPLEPALSPHPRVLAAQCQEGFCTLVL